MLPIYCSFVSVDAAARSRCEWQLALRARASRACSLSKVCSSASSRALSVTLLVGEALLITSFIRLSQQNLGFRSQNLWTGAITLPTSQYPDRPSRQRFVEQTLHELRSVPGLESATISGDIPLVGFSR